MFDVFLFQEVDWALGKFTVTDNRDSVIDYTAPYWHESGQILMMKPAARGLLLYSGPFRREVWLFLFLSVPIMTIILVAANCGETHIGESARTLHDMCLWLIFGAVFQQGDEQLNPY